MANAYRIPVAGQPWTVAGLVAERAEAREAEGGLAEAPAAVRAWASDGEFVYAKQPCAECRHFRFEAGQALLAQRFVRLDLNDLGWDRYVKLRALGRCALNAQLLVHRWASCDRWDERSQAGKGDRRR